MDSDKLGFSGMAAQEAEGAHKSTLGGSVMNDGDAAGVTSGLASLAGFDSYENVQKIDDTTGRIVSNPQSESASKYGETFEIK
jgi:hypothetical protein